MAEWTGIGGSAGGVMFSPDKAQKFLYISDLTNNHVWFLNRDDGKIVGQIGSMGHNAGESSRTWKPWTRRATSAPAKSFTASACNGSSQPSRHSLGCDLRQQAAGLILLHKGGDPALWSTNPVHDLFGLRVKCPVIRADESIDSDHPRHHHLTIMNRHQLP